LFMNPALTLPGALRRITVGASMSSGGVNWRGRSVIPAGLMPPFSRQNLRDQQTRASGGWQSVISPYIEHDVGFIRGTKLKAGYQYWKQMGSAAGFFRPCDDCEEAGYDVRLKFSSHLARISVNQGLYPEDSDTGPNKPRRPIRKSGLIRQFGVMMGTNRTIIIFVGVGPFLEIPR
jgi:hypothetical protein